MTRAAQRLASSPPLAVAELARTVATIMDPDRLALFLGIGDRALAETLISGKRTSLSIARRLNRDLGPHTDPQAAALVADVLPAIRREWQRLSGWVGLALRLARYGTGFTRADAQRFDAALGAGAFAFAVMMRARLAIPTASPLLDRQRLDIEGVRDDGLAALRAWGRHRLGAAHVWLLLVLPHDDRETAADDDHDLAVRFGPALVDAWLLTAPATRDASKAEKAA